MFIVNPLSGKSLMSLFSTHPPLEERIGRLRGYPSQTGRASKSGEDRRLTEGKAFWNRLSK
jgi:heat shock protein HtpX